MALFNTVSLLAQADRPSSREESGLVAGLQNLFETVTNMFQHGDALAQPEHLVPELQKLSALWAIVFLIVGMLCLLNGFKFYKAVTIGLALILGSFAGYYLGRHIDAPFVVAGCLGMLLAVAALPMMKYAVALFGGLAGAFVGANLWGGIAQAVNRAWELNVPASAYGIGAFLGLVICGMVTFALFKLSVVMFTSVGGATFAVLGALALLMSYDPWQKTIADQLQANSLVVPLLVFVPALIGLILQESNWLDSKTESSGNN